MSVSSSNRSIQIKENAVGSSIISGDGNTIYVIHQATEQIEQATRVEQPSREPSTKIGPNPYRGLAAFNENNAGQYFGREVQVKRLWQRFQALYEQSMHAGELPRLLPILGPSGCGKSSLARAGLIPELARRPLIGKEQMRIAVLVPGVCPIEALAGVLAKAATQDSVPVTKTREFAAELRLRNEVGHYDGMRRIVDLIPQIDSAPLVVLIDQFEEVYSLCKDTVEREAFINNLLCAATAPTGNVSVVLTLRSDFLGETQRHQLLTQTIGSDRSIIVPGMTEAELRRAIAEPAKQAGYPLSESMVSLLVQDTEGREGALPLLQFALTRIWEGLSKGKSPTETYQEMGGVGGALAGRAQEIYDELSGTEKEIVRRVFIGLVQLGEGTRDTRRRVAVSSLVAYRDRPETVEQAIGRFSSPGSRLVTLSSQEGEDIAEVTHEALFDHWQLLNSWLDNSRDSIRFQRRLETDVVYWQKQDYPEGSLWRRPELDLLKNYHQQFSQEMTPLQLRFFRVSTRAEQKRKLYKGLSVAALVVLSGATSLLAITAQRTKRESLASQLAIKSEWVGTQKEALSTTSALLAVRALSTFEKARDAPLEVDQALRSGLRLLPAVEQQFSHDGSARVVNFSPNGRTIATAAGDNTARLWNVRSGKEIAIFKHESSVNAVSFSPNGQTIATASSDGTTRLWNAKSGKELTVFKHESSVNAVSFSPDGQTIATASSDGTARLWNAKSGKELTVFEHESSVNAVSFSPKGQTIATASSDGTARLWNAKSGKELTVFEHESSVNAVSFSSSAAVVATASSDGTARLWDPYSGEERTVLNHQGSVNAVSFGPVVGMIATASSDGTVRLWSPYLVEELAILKHESSVNAVSFSPSGQAIATASADGTVQLWSPRSSKELAILNHESLVNSASFSPSGQAIATASFDGTVRLWDASSGEELAVLKHDDWVPSVNFSPDDQTVATASIDGTVRLWDASSGEELIALNHNDSAFSVNFSPNGQTVVTASLDGTARLWNASSGEELAILKHKDSVSSASFSPNGQTIATKSDDDIVRLWNASSGEELIALKHNNSVSSVSFSPDSRTIVTTSSDSTARLWDVRSGEEIVTFNHEKTIFSVSFSPNGQTIATASIDSTARLWNVRSGEELAILRHESAVNAVSFSPDGQTIVTANNNAARLWNARSGEELAILRHAELVNAVSFSPDGQTIATASNDHTARLWYQSRSVLADKICDRIGRNLTASEWSTYLKIELRHYELTCPSRPVHSSLLEKAKQYAQSDAKSDQQKAIAIFRRAQKLDPGVDLDPSTIDVKEQDPKVFFSD